MSLLRKASIVTTPTAYENGKILSVKPSIVLGEELITNGNFVTDSDWTKNEGWSIESGVAKCDGNNQKKIYQNIGLAANKYYEFTIEVKTLTSGAIRLFYYNGSYQIVTSSLGLGIHTVQFYTSGTPNGFIYINSDSFIGSIDNVSVKEAIDGDFQFTRNSSATRVNLQGLIEDMQILSGDLISNGDFSQESAELVTNVDFATDSDWLKTGSIEIANGQAIATNEYTQYLFQSTSLVVGKFYKITFTVSDYISGIVTSGLSDNLSNAGANRTANGTYTDYIKFTGGNTFIGVLFTNNASMSIDNVSVKEVGQDWSLPGGWSVEDGLLVNDGTGVNLSAEQSGFFTVGNKYRVSLDVKSITQGSLEIYLGFPQSDVKTINSSGSYTYDIVASGNTTFYVKPLSGFIGSITNITILEITDDTNLPRIDYTGGEGHWLFEPQLTNLIPYSEDFSQWNADGDTTIESGYLAPDGTNNAYKVSGTNGALRLDSVSNLGINTTRSIYARTVSGSGTASLTSYFGNTNNIFTLTEQWQRFEVNNSISTGSTIFYGADFRGGTLNELILWGANATNDQSYATSYIPTEGSIKTRLQDAANGAGSSDLINSESGVLYAEIAALDDGGTNYKVISVSDGTNNNRTQFSLRLNAIVTYVSVGGSVQYVHIETVTNILDYHKIALVYKQNDYKLFINGTMVNSSASGNTFPQNTLTELSFTDGVSSNFYGKTKCVAVFKEALNNDELECLTGEGYDSFNALALANNYTII